MFHGTTKENLSFASNYNSKLPLATWTRPAADGPGDNINMLPPRPRKRSLDHEDDYDVENRPRDKRYRPSKTHDEPLNSFGYSAQTSTDAASSSLVHISDRPQDESPGSIASEPGSGTDVDMDDQEASEDSRMHFSQSPELHSSWSLYSSPIRTTAPAGSSSPSTRIPTPMVRPRPAPLQTRGWPSGLHAPATKSALATLTERFPSPVSEDEPHTPTTAAGSQLSMLTVNDVDMSEEPPDPPPSVVVRKQRQRSGAFITSPEVARKFSMGFRDDCEKCRNKVPGHMNHFLGSS